MVLCSVMSAMRREVCKNGFLHAMKDDFYLQ
jgi:hypothetical protein